MFVRIYPTFGITPPHPLYLEEECNGVTNSHYVLITNYESFITGKENNHIYLCIICGLPYSSEQARDNHYNNWCKNNTLCKTVMPKEGENILKFKHWNRKSPTEFRLYGRFHKSRS